MMATSTYLSTRRVDLPLDKKTMVLKGLSALATYKVSEYVVAVIAKFKQSRANATTGVVMNQQPK